MKECLIVIPRIQIIEIKIRVVVIAAISDGIEKRRFIAAAVVGYSAVAPSIVGVGDLLLAVVVGILKSSTSITDLQYR